MLARTPLIIKPRKTPIDLDRQDSVNENLPPPIVPTIVAASNEPKPESTVFPNYYQQNLQLHPFGITTEKQKEVMQLDVTPCVSDKPSGELTTQNRNWDILTPDDAQINFLGLSNVNYDIDFSDLSADNSVADELTPEKHKSLTCTPDPFSPVGSFCNITQTPLIPSSAAMPAIRNNTEFDLLSLDNEPETILDKQEAAAASLPSPLQPTTSQYSGFSKQGFQIPSIPCHTGDYSSLSLEDTRKLHIDWTQKDDKTSKTYTDKS